MVVLDTSALLYWTLDPEKLSPRAVTLIGDADRLLVSSISIWEVAIKVKRERLGLPITVRDYLERLLEVDHLELVNVDPELWLASIALDWAHRDPADRVIVALARRHLCPLITSDQEMRAFYPEAMW